MDMNDVAQNPSRTTADSAAESGEEYQPLLDVAVPTVYRANAFRMIGLRMDASERDVARRSERLRMEEKPGAALRAEGPLPLDPPPDGNAIREALQRLRDPEHRLVEELFWFWPMDAIAREDPALEALTAGDTTTAVQIWREHGGIGAHNLAVLFHATALDLDLSPEPLRADAQKRRDRCWRESFSSWKTAIDSEEFWSRLTARIRELQDPRLTTGTGRRIRAALPRTLLSISARLAVSATERQSAADSARHIKYMNESGFSEAAREQALRLALTPLRQRVLSLCQSAAPEASAAPEHADQVAIRLLDSTAPLLAAFSLLREGEAPRESVHDEVALGALTCQIKYGRKTEDWDGSLALLHRILTVAASASARQNIQSNLEIVEQNVAFKREYGTCWFCRTREPVDAADAEVKMHGNVTRTRVAAGVQVNWSKLTVKVPRCEICKAAARSAEQRLALVFIVFALIGFASCGALGLDRGAILGIAGLVAGGVAGVIAKRTTLHGAKPRSHAKVFPEVLRKKQEGWRLGEKPAGVQ
jgi:hypothetical protein